MNFFNNTIISIYGMLHLMAAMKCYEVVSASFAYPVGKRALESVDSLDHAWPDPLHQPASTTDSTFQTQLANLEVVQ